MRKLWFAAVIAVLTSAPVEAAQVYWVGLIAGYWHDTYNWSSHPYLPGPNDDARVSIAGIGVVEHNTGSHTVKSLTCDEIFNLSGGALTLSAASYCPTAFYLTGGSLYGTGSLSIGGSSVWSAGNIAITGGVTNNGVLEISGAGWKPVRGALTNTKTVTHKAAIDVSSGGTLNNNWPNGVYDIVENAGVTCNLGSGYINNTGLLKKSAGTGLADIAPYIWNRGDVRSASGTLQLSGGGLLEDGYYTAESGCALNLANETHTVKGYSYIQGSGVICLNSGTVQLADFSTLQNTMGGALRLIAGYISGNGKLENRANMEWYGTIFLNAGNIENKNTLWLHGASSKEMRGSIVGNSGTMMHQGTGNLVLSNSSRFHNLQNGTYDLQSDADWLSSGGTSSFHNSGILRKSYSYGVSDFQPFFYNWGLVDVDTGMLRLQGGGQFVNCGAEVMYPSTLCFNQGTYTFYNTFEAGGSGHVLLNGGTISYTYGATTRFGMEGGLQLAGSTVAGEGNLINTWNTDWSSGTITGLCHLVNEGTMTLSGPDEKVLGQSQFANIRDIVHSGTGSLRLNSQATMANTTNSTYEFRQDSSIVGTGTINHSGMFRKKWSYGTSAIEATLNLIYGGFQIETGTIRLMGGGNFYGGGANILGNCNLNITSGNYTINETFQALGDGSSALSGGIITLAQGSHMQFGLTGGGLKMQGTVFKGPGALANTGNWEWTGGGFTDSSSATNGSTATLSGAGTKQLHASRIFNSGTITHSGTGPLEFSQGAVLDNAGTYEFKADGSITNPDTTGVINNGGFVVKQWSNGITRIKPAFNNQGTIEVRSGTLCLDGGGTFYQSSASVLGNTRLEFASGNFTLAGELVSTGDGTVVIGTNLVFGYGGRALFHNAEGVKINAGTIAGPGSIESTSLIDWTNGTIAEEATILNKGTMAISGNQTKYLNRARLANLSLLRHTGTGHLATSSGSVVDIAYGGTYTIQGDCSITGAGKINVGGLLQKTGDAGKTTIEPTLSTNGTVEVQSGMLYFAGPIEQVVDGVLTGGTWVVQPNCNLSLGEIRLVSNNANVTLNGNCLFPNLDGLRANNGVLKLYDGHHFSADAVFSNTGTLEQASGEFYTKKTLNTGLWRGASRIFGSLTNKGQLQLEHTWGGFRIGGNFAQETDGSLRVRLAGTQSGQFGRLEVVGSASLGGKLEITRTKFYAPRRGDMYNIVSCRSRLGKFESITGIDLGNGLFINPIYTSTGVTLVVGDYLSPADDLASAAAVRQAVPGAWVSAPGVVSAVFDGAFFVQDFNRAAGIRVVSTQEPPKVGQNVVVVGRVEPYRLCVSLEMAGWCPDGSPDSRPPSALFMSQKNLGGATLGLQQGVYKGSGLCNIGLLVKVAGKVTYHSPGSFAYIDDGSGLYDGNTLGHKGLPVLGVRVVFPPGVDLAAGTKWASVTGVSYREYIADRPQRAILVRSEKDISVQ